MNERGVGSMIHRAKRNVRLRAFLVVLALLAFAVPATGQSHILRVVTYWDPLDGDPVRHPARINVSRSYMTDTCYIHAGSPSGPSRLYNRPDTTGVFPYSYVGQTGEFLVSLPDSITDAAVVNVRVRAYMGPEALADTVVIAWDAANATVRCTIEQVVDMADSGWHCIDPWVHLTDTSYDAYDIDREDVRAVMEAEGLDAINCLDASWDDTTFTYGRNVDTALWNDHQLALWFQHQIQDGVWGYVLPMRTSASPTVGDTLTAHLGQRSPGFMAERWYDRVDSLSGFSILAGGHRVRGLADTATSHGARRVARDLWFSPFDATLTNPDAYLLCEPLMGCPIDEANRTDAAPNARTYASYRKMLAAGGDVVPIVAGSDASLNRWIGRAAVGSWRTYVKMGEYLPTSWYPVVLSRGHSYVTNGPLITYAKLDGKDIGTTVLASTFPDTFTLTVGIHSPIAVDSIRIWLNESIYSVENLALGVTDTTYTTDIVFFGGVDSRLWFDLVAKNDDDYLNWTEAQSDGRLYAISNVWNIDFPDRIVRPERSASIYTNALTDTINTLYVTAYDSWPDKHTTRSSVDSLTFVTHHATVDDAVDERYLWMRPTGRTDKDGTAEFPFTTFTADAVTQPSAGDTMYYYAGVYSRSAVSASIVTSNVVYRGFPEISRPSQVAINIAAVASSTIMDAGATDITWKWMCFRNATAIGNYKAVFQMTAVSDWTIDHVWFKNLNCNALYDNGCLKFSTSTGDIIIRDCVFDSLSGGRRFVGQFDTAENVRWERNRIIRTSVTEHEPLYFFAVDTLRIYDSLWSQVYAGNNNGPGMTISTPGGPQWVRGCTFDDVETSGVSTNNGVIFVVGAGCENYVRVSNCVFSNSDSTNVIGFSSVAQIDSLSYSLGFNCTDWPPAAADTVGLRGTDPHFNLTRMDRLDTFRPTDTRAWGLATMKAFMGWTEARPPTSSLSLINNQYGSSTGGGAGAGRPPKPTRSTAIPPPGS